MCGFVGYLGSGITSKIHGERVLQRMADTIAHRGPDSAGYWLDTEQHIGLGHRRLSIVDLSSAGHQPMRSESHRYVIAFNGEIYNHLELRKELHDSGAVINWRGTSDTETLLAGFDAWGIRGMVERAIGMFALAVWDRKNRTLTLARDRIGEKPVYYGWQGHGDHAAFLFGSELKGLKAHLAFEGTVNRDALCLQLRHNYIPAPHSIYKGIFKLMPGTLLTVSMNQREPAVSPYWSMTEAAERGVDNSFTGNDHEVVDTLEFLLMDAVRKQMMADVPLGAFLSGGVDSSTVVALMQAQTSRQVKTFTIGFHEDEFNEAKHAKAVATHLGTDHTELYVTANEARDVIPHLPTLYDEPFSDSSQIPTFLVSQLARQHVTVALSGDAGDELFCGYTRYVRTASVWEKLAATPMPFRWLAAKGLTSISPQSWNSLAGTVKRYLPLSAQSANIGDKLHKGAKVLNSKTCDALYLNLTSHWHSPESIVIGGIEPSTLANDRPPLHGLDNIQRAMAVDMLTYLPECILTKVDRAAMGVSLETRVPFLDHRVVELAWRLPQSMKLRDGQTKWALRQVLYRHVPKPLIERPKMGFGVPIADWLRGPLRDWAESLLDRSRLRDDGFFQADQVRQKWKEHLSGDRNWQYHLWDVLMFQAWLEAKNR
jgi:asparagine synthase (glutamine-hydrolysing)